LLKNEHEVSKFYQANDLKKLDLMPLKYEKLSSVKYKINIPTENFVIFAESHNKNWQLGEQKPLQLNAVNEYEYENNSNLNYKRFRAYLVSYIISIIMLIYLLFQLKITSQN